MVKIIVGECNGKIHFATLGTMKDGSDFTTTDRVRAAYWVPTEDSKNKKKREEYVNRIFNAGIFDNPRLVDLSDFDDLMKSQENSDAAPSKKKAFNIFTAIKSLTKHFK